MAQPSLDFRVSVVDLKNSSQKGMDSAAIQAHQMEAYKHVNAAFEDETNLFIHVHLRGYDEEGKGLIKNAMFFDRYGAPIRFEHTWKEGYRSIEEHLLSHNLACINKYTYFPMVGGYGGGAHLYEKYHKTEPYKWTGWIPLQRHLPYNAVSPTGSTENVMYHNRFFPCLRGNEIQNDMWDYDPITVTDEDVKGQYLGGYWYNIELEKKSELDKMSQKEIDEEKKKRVLSRYLHIMALKNHQDVAGSNPVQLRYNYIVHPLAYRVLLDNLPDCGVDYIQWAINNISKEFHFKTDGNWGSKVNGIEVFNDYT